MAMPGMGGAGMGSSTSHCSTCADAAAPAMSSAAITTPPCSFTIPTAPLLRHRLCPVGRNSPPETLLVLCPPRRPSKWLLLGEFDRSFLLSSGFPGPGSGENGQGAPRPLHCAHAARGALSRLREVPA